MGSKKQTNKHKKPPPPPCDIHIYIYLHIHTLMKNIMFFCLQSLPFSLSLSFGGKRKGKKRVVTKINSDKREREARRMLLQLHHLPLKLAMERETVRTLFQKYILLYKCNKMYYPQKNDNVVTKTKQARNIYM